MISSAAPSDDLVKHCGPMGIWQKRVDLVSLPVERKRVCAWFRAHHLLAAHCFNINDVDYARISDRHVKAAEWPLLQKYYIRRPAQTNIADRLARVRVNREQHASIAGAHQAAGSGIEIQSVRPRRRNLVLP